MDLKELQKHWDAFGKHDPLWAILSYDGTINNGWDEAEFFRTGQREISGVVDLLRQENLPLRTERALDFGCGVGRLTQAMCEYFAEADGVDISPAMIERAQRYNKYAERCRYAVNDTDDLSRFDSESFDFVYSNIVLQHMAPTYSERYIREFVRLLRSGGSAVFQVPSELRFPPPEAGSTAAEQTADQPVPTLDTTRLDDAAFAAAIEPLIATITCAASSVLTVPVVVTNLSSVTWPGRAQTAFPIRLGNHWRSRSGALVVLDDGRASFADAVLPGHRVRVPLDCRAPATPGEYLLEFDIIQEFVAWGSDKGCAVARIPVTVSGTVEEPSDGAQSTVEVPRMEMYGIPRPEVERMLLEAGGEIVRVEDDDRAGDEWISYRYIVTKP